MHSIHLQSRIRSLAAALPIATITTASALDTAGLPASVDRVGFSPSSEQDASNRMMEPIFPTAAIKAGYAIRSLPVSKAHVEISFVQEHRPHIVTVTDAIDTAKITQAQR